MADAKGKDKDKDKGKSKGKPAPKPEAKGKDKAKDKDKGKEKKAKAKETEVVEAPVAKAPPPPRPPADPRLKVLKKFDGRFLPKGPLRDRLKILMTRWNSGDDHDNVTHEELKALLNDWRAYRVKPTKTKA